MIPTNNISDIRAQVKIRSRHQKAWAQITILSGQTAQVYFDEPQDAITPGQGCVFYENSRVIARGWISRVKASTQV